MSSIIRSPSTVVTAGDVQFTSVSGEVILTTGGLDRFVVQNDGEILAEGAISYKELASTPSTPSSGYGKLYPKSDNNLYFLDDTGSETNLCSGGGGGGGWADDGVVVRLVTAADDVGIGTALPSNKLTVSGDMDIIGKLGINNATPTYDLDVTGSVNATVAFRLNGNLLFASGVVFIDKEIPTGLINGSNRVFTLISSPVSGSLHLFLNGVLQEEGAGKDYQVSGNTITYEVGNAPTANSKHLASYRK